MDRESIVSESINETTSAWASGTACTTLHVAAGLAVNCVVGMMVALASAVGAAEVDTGVPEVVAAVGEAGETAAGDVCVGGVVQAETRNNRTIKASRLFCFINCLLLQD
jgi:hypothetical protein